jgi:hypothetical protein
VVGNLVLRGADRHTPLVLHDVGTGASARLRWPSRADYGLGEATGDPKGRLAIVEFAKYSPEHRLDLWVLDTTTRRWRHLPDMPAPMVPKATNVQWTADGAWCSCQATCSPSGGPASHALPSVGCRRPSNPAATS